MTFLILLTVVIAATALPAMAAPVLFTAAGQLSDGGTLGGTVTIDPVTGALVAVDLSVTVNQTYVFSHNLGGIPNYSNSGLFMIAVNAALNGYPVALIGLNETTLVGYNGGPISASSNVLFENSEYFLVTSGNFELLSTFQSRLAQVRTFGATGSVAGNPLSGRVVIDVTTGTVVSSTLTAVIPKTHKVSSNIGAIPNYADSGQLAIIADNASDYPVAILGFNLTSLVGYAGGEMAPSSVVYFADGSHRSIISGSLTGPTAAVPEPSTFWIFGDGGRVAGGGAVAEAGLIWLTRALVNARM